MSAPPAAWDALIRRWLNARGLPPADAVERLAGGQSNHVFRLRRALAEDTILRVRPPEKPAGSLRVEAAVLQRIAGALPAPDVRAMDFTQTILPGDAVLTSALPGRPFARVWVAAPPHARKALALQLGEALRRLHLTPFPVAGIAPIDDWRAHWEARLERRFPALAELGALPPELESAARTVMARCLPALDERPAALLHGDLHPGNLLAAGDRLTGIVDWELAQAGPLDLELDPLLRCCRDPRPFLGAGEATTFAELPAALRRAYPDPWAAPRLAERLTLYALDYELSALRAAHAGRWAREAVAIVEARLAAVLSGE